MRIFALFAALAAAVLLPAATHADNPQLVGTVGPGYTIALVDSTGKAVTQLAPGTYDVLVHDRADIHNFHLLGPGVDVSTEVDFVGDRTFTVTFRDGDYAFVCDPHSDAMAGKFTAGTGSGSSTGSSSTGSSSTGTPKQGTTAKAASARVGPGRTLAFPARLAHGKYVITVRDLSAADNLHLRGPGVDRRTGVAFRGTAKWTVVLKAGRYRVYSDAHTGLTRTLAVT
jgi:plastocyanin